MKKTGTRILCLVMVGMMLFGVIAAVVAALFG